MPRGGSWGIMVWRMTELLVVNELARKRQDTENGGHHVNIFTKMPWKLSFGNWKHLKCVFSFHNLSLKNQRIKWWKQKLKTMPNRFLSRGTHIFWVIGDGNKVISYGNNKSKQPLSFHDSFIQIFLLLILLFQLC